VAHPSFVWAGFFLVFAKGRISASIASLKGHQPRPRKRTTVASLEEGTQDSQFGPGCVRPVTLFLNVVQQAR
jgi:hypothetical protein